MCVVGGESENEGGSMGDWGGRGVAQVNTAERNLCRNGKYPSNSKIACNKSFVWGGDGGERVIYIYIYLVGITNVHSIFLSIFFERPLETKNATKMLSENIKRNWEDPPGGQHGGGS